MDTSPTTIQSSPAQPSSAPTYAALHRAAVHEARALVRGDDECSCRTCSRVRAWQLAEQRANKRRLSEMGSGHV